jgi:hypothetical protein
VTHAYNPSYSEGEIERILAEGQLGQKVSETPAQQQAGIGVCTCDHSTKRRHRQEDHGLRPAPGDSSRLSEKQNQDKLGHGSRGEVQDPGFKHQYCQKKKRGKEERNSLCLQLHDSIIQYNNITLKKVLFKAPLRLQNCTTFKLSLED